MSYGKQKYRTQIGIKMYLASIGVLYKYFTTNLRIFLIGIETSVA